MEKIVISCLESRVETNRRMYARFLLGPFQDDNAITIATALRRSLLSKVKSIAITSIHIQGVTNEFCTIVGVRESVLDLALNFQQIVLRTRVDNPSKRHSHLLRQTETVEKQYKKQALYPLLNPNSRDQAHTQKLETGYLQVQGPRLVYANDLKLPIGVECVDPTQYIATLSTEGRLVVRFTIGTRKASLDTKSGALTGTSMSVEDDSLYTLKKGLEHKDITVSNIDNNRESYQDQYWINRWSTDRNGQRNSQPLVNAFRLFDPTICLRHTILLDPIFSSVLQANYVIEKDDIFNQVRERIVLEFWTNGSIHPRQALHKASLSLISTFSIFRKLFHLDSL